MTHKSIRAQYDLVVAEGYDRGDTTDGSSTDKKAV